MLQNIKETMKHTLIYSLGNISSKLVGFVLLPIYTRELIVASYGILGLMELVDVLATHILSFGLTQGLMRWYSLENEETQKRRFVFSVFTFLILVCVTCFFIVILIRYSLSDLLFHSPDYHQLFILAFAAISFTVLNKIPLTLLRLEKRSVLYSIGIASQFTIHLVLSVYFVAYLKLGVKGILMAQCMSTGLLFIVLLPYHLKRMLPDFLFADLKDMLIFSCPFVFSALAATILNMGNRFLLERLATLRDVGLYTLGYKFGNVLKLFVIDAFSLGLPIIGWRVVKNDDNPKRFFSKSLTYLLFVTLWLGLVIASFSKGIVHRFAQNQDYWAAADLIPILILGVVFMGVHRVLLFLLQIPKKTKFIPFIVGIAAVSNILLNFLLVPRLGVSGSAYSILISHAILCTISVYIVKREYPVRLEFKRISKLLTVVIFLYIIMLPINSGSIILRVVIKSVIILSYPIVLWLIGFFESIELERISGFINKYFHIHIKLNN